MDTQPTWLRSERPQFSKFLPGQGSFDVVVIGGGITGLTAAWALKQNGLRVCVLEKGRIGGGETGHTSAHLAAQIDQKVTDITEKFGADAARLVWRGGQTSLDFIESTVHAHGIDCGFHRIPGFLVGSLANEESGAEASLIAEAEQCGKLGIPAEYLPGTEGLCQPAVRFIHQGRFDPIAYLAGLAQLVEGEGSAIHEHSEVTEVQGDPMRLTVNGSELTCDRLIIATHVPLAGKSGLISATLLQTKIYPHSTYVLQGEVPRGACPDALYWDTSSPYHYLRIIPGAETDSVIFGGADHKTGQVLDTEKQYAQLEAVLFKLFPEVKLTNRWSGQVIETNDGLPYIGETAQGQFVATGFSGNGLTFGTLAGLMACDWVLDRPNPWSKLFSPARIHLWGGTWEYLVENVDFPLYLASQWMLTGKREPAAHIRPGEGEVLVMNGQRVACSRSQQGELHQVSAVCTHLGCLVRWNGAEQTWDCPCHGSRFSPTGEVIGGPAERPLAPHTEEPSGRTPPQRETVRSQ